MQERNYAMNKIEALNEQNNLLTVGDQDFEAKILRSPQPMVVDFTANWCPPCHRLVPVYQRLSAEYQGKLGFARLDIDEHPMIPARFRVQAAPTIIFFKDGKEIERVVGPHPGRLKDLIEAVLTKHSII
jgi:thioredoxin 1